MQHAASAGDAQLIAAALFGIAAIVILISWLKLHPFISLGIGALCVGVAANLGLAKSLVSFSNGFGATMAGVGILMGLGAMFGKLLADFGGADQIVDTLVSRSRPQTLPWTMGLVGAIIGLADVLRDRPRPVDPGRPVGEPAIGPVGHQDRFADARRPVGHAWPGAPSPRTADRRDGARRQSWLHPRLRHRDRHSDRHHSQARCLRSSPTAGSKFQRRKCSERAKPNRRGPGPCRTSAQRSPPFSCPSR